MCSGVFEKGTKVRQHLISLYNINPLIKTLRNEGYNLLKIKNVLMFKHILPTTYRRDIRNTVRRTWIFILEVKGVMKSKSSATVTE